MSYDPQHGQTPPAQSYPPPAQGYPPPGYPQQTYPQQNYSPPSTNTMAILSLIFAFIFWPLAIVFGHIAYRQIARTGEGGRSLATVGLVLGYVFLGLTLLLIIGFVVLAGAAVSNDPYSLGLRLPS